MIICEGCAKKFVEKGSFEVNGKKIKNGWTLEAIKFNNWYRYIPKCPSCSKKLNRYSKPYYKKKGEIVRGTIPDLDLTELKAIQKQVELSPNYNTKEQMECIIQTFENMDDEIDRLLYYSSYPENID